MYDIAFNGVTARSRGLFVERRPAIPAPEEEIEIFQVAGKDGILTGDSRLNPIEIAVDLAFRSKSADMWAEHFRDIKGWLKGSGHLIQSDDPEWFFKVNYVKLQDFTRNLKKYGGFRAVFNCDPYTYRVDGQDEITLSGNTLENLYDSCHPIFIVYGSGSRILYVNGNEATVTGQDVVVIDTDRMITYTQTTGGVANTRLTGDYEGLYLNPGSNTITCASAVHVIPNWRRR